MWEVNLRDVRARERERRIFARVGEWMPEHREMADEIEEVESDRMQKGTQRETSQRMPLTSAYNSASCCERQKAGRGQRM